MDMNRYLIVVFCVITGCATTVPMADAQELLLDDQMFVTWCAEHAPNIDKLYAEPVVVEIKTAEICYVNKKSTLLLKNLPQNLVAKPIVTTSYFVEDTPKEFFPLGNCNMYSTLIAKGNPPIRAPGF